MRKYFNSISKKNKIFLFIIIGVVLILGISESFQDESFLNFNKTKPANGPPRFKLTEKNGNKLEKIAIFTVQRDNNMQLQFDGGTTIIYKPYFHSGTDPICNISAMDELRRKSEICIKKLKGNKVMITLKYDDSLDIYKGYKY